MCWVKITKTGEQGKGKKKYRQGDGLSGSARFSGGG